MNMFTIAQLANHNTGTTYYDTSNGTIKYTPSPTLTMLGYANYDIKLNKNVHKQDSKQHNKEPKQHPKKRNKDEDTNEVTNEEDVPISMKKRTRKAMYVPDKERCCAIKLDGTPCTLKICVQSKELCHIHYQKSLPKIKTVPEVNKSNTKCFTMKWW